MNDHGRIRTNPVFVVGMNGSGTTMVVDCLENSPELYVFPRETRMIPWMVSNVDRFGDLADTENRRRLLKTFCNFHPVRAVRWNSKVEDIEASEPSLFGVIDAVYGAFAATQGKRRWVEKSPMNVQAMRQIAEAMPTAQFVHIYRDGRDVAQSDLRRFKKNPFWTMHRWTQIVRQARVDGQQLGAQRYFELTYEYFTQSPESAMRDICAFIGIGFSPELLRSSMPFVKSVHHWVRTEKSGTIVPNSEKWRQFFSTDEIARLEAIGGMLLAELGYGPSNPTGNQPPPAWRLALWRYCDVVNQGVIFLKRYGIRKDSLRRLLKRLAEGLKSMSVERH